MENTQKSNLHIDLRLNKSYQSQKKFYKEKIQSYKIYTDQHPDFKIGDSISFWSGYNNDIRYTSEILGFDTDGDIYVLWDCYWSPISNNKEREITLT